MTDNTGDVRLHAITKRFRSGAVGIDDVSLSVSRGEFVTFLGPSGSGKTTTLNAIAGFIRPTSGRIEIAGRDVTALPPSRRNLGVVFQNYALFPHMTVRENVAFGLHGRGLGKAEMIERIDETLRMVHLDALADRSPKQISGGQQQRVALARALVYRPPVLLMDEPLSALDKALRDSMQVEISRIHRQVGTTFLFVTHDQGEALGLSDRIVLFNKGRVVQVGSPSDLYERPETLFTAQFLGESNIFRGESSGGGTVRFVDQELRVDGAASAGTIAIVVRPERLMVASPGSFHSQNRVAANVLNVAYFGAFRRVSVRYADGSHGLLHLAAEGASPLSAGDSVEVSWHPADGIVITDDADGVV